ncbi:hypothetical protein O181_121011 [Austropuccinia psidii MF-1]|uniref:Uncharacterized protein n=1 Tax=Austropuccinia psidii MF-1 TaxID=1389203 RepID=A0A9Q3KIR8_9BASI|nr:hypothetical protein [Austropuccinia psidii MF-1]
MTIQNSPPARQTRPKARAQAILTPNPRAPLDGTPEVPQLRAQLDRGPRSSRTIFKGSGEDGEEEESDGTEGVPSPVGAAQGT